jgi:hypothetical protein
MGMQPGDVLGLLSKSYLLESYFAKLCDHHASSLYQPNEATGSYDACSSQVLSLVDRIDTLFIECLHQKRDDPRASIFIRFVQQARSVFTPQEQVQLCIF